MFYKQYEDDLGNAVQKFKIKLKETNQVREDLRAKISGLRQDLKENLDELEECKKELQKMEKQKKHIRGQGDAAKYFSRKMSMRGEVFKKEARYTEISEEIAVEMGKNSKIVESLDQECTMIRKEISIIRDAQIKHYSNLLKEGKDTRSEGLEWIVKALWKLKQNIEKSRFPIFLDEKSIECILTLAKKTKELEEMLGKGREGSIEKAPKMHVSKGKWNGIHSRLAEASKIVRTKKPDFLTCGRKYTVVWENCSPDHSDFKSFTLEGVVAFEMRLTSLRAEIKSIREQEIHRVFRECFLNGYEFKRRTDLSLLLSSIVGIENITKYSTLLIKLKRDLSEKLITTKTFTFN